MANFRPNQSFTAPVTKLKAVTETTIHAHKFSQVVLLDINANEYGEYTYADVVSMEILTTNAGSFRFVGDAADTLLFFPGLGFVSAVSFCENKTTDLRQHKGIESC